MKTPDSPDVTKLPATPAALAPVSGSTIRIILYSVWWSSAVTSMLWEKLYAHHPMIWLPIGYGIAGLILWIIGGLLSKTELSDLPINNMTTILKRRSSRRRTAGSLKRVVRRLLGGKWEVVRTIWPYRDGYGVYNRSRRTLLEHGLTKERAQQICDHENSAAS